MKKIFEFVRAFFAKRRRAETQLKYGWIAIRESDVRILYRVRSGWALTIAPSVSAAVSFCEDYGIKTCKVSEILVLS